MSFNEANGDMTKHPAAFIRQESSMPGAFDACLSSKISRIHPPVLPGDFVVSLSKSRYEMSQSVACMFENVTEAAACRTRI